MGLVNSTENSKTPKINKNKKKQRRKTQKIEKINKINTSETDEANIHTNSSTAIQKSPVQEQNLATQNQTNDANLIGSVCWSRSLRETSSDEVSDESLNNLVKVTEAVKKLEGNIKVEGDKEGEAKEDLEKEKNSEDHGPGFLF